MSPDETEDSIKGRIGGIVRRAPGSHAMLAFKMELSTERLEIGQPTTLYLYSVESLPGQQMGLRIVVSKDPMEQGLTALIREAFRYLITVEFPIPELYQVTLGEAHHELF